VQGVVALHRMEVCFMVTLLLRDLGVEVLDLSLIVLVLLLLFLHEL
jgi:hypothetical protein